MQGQGQWSILIIYVLLFGLLYWFFWRPQRQQQRRRAEMLAKVKKGDRIVTVGGLYATVAEANEDTLVLELTSNVRVRAERSAVGHVRGKREG